MCVHMEGAGKAPQPLSQLADFLLQRTSKNLKTIYNELAVFLSKWTDIAVNIGPILN